jgi:glycosyltransferase involved in cell wall biosynthesis
MFAVRSRYWVKRASDFWQTRNCETFFARTFASTVFCSEHDRENFLRHHSVDGRRLFVVPNVVSGPRGDIPCADWRPQGRAPVLLFVGALNYLVNVQALRWFVETVWPLFVQRFPGGRLMVVGRTPKEEVVELCRRDNIILHPDVPSVAPFYSDCDAVVVPLLHGSGTRLKIIEAALHSRPVISTPVGAEGLDFVEGRDLLSFEDGPSFVAAIEELGRPGRACDIARSAKNEAVRRYSLTAFHDAFDEVIASLA